MSEEESINKELLEIIKALTAKIENLERTVYNDDNLLMKSGFVVVDSPSPTMKVIDTKEEVSGMEWSEIHKMVDSMG
tara:strand:- start:7110 stop:7340 length:231 start_codon:yes stop_codon:yes gene_type:complete